MLTKEEKSMIRAEYKKAWPKSEKMVDFCTNQVAAIAELPGGALVTVDKQRIEKDFCFGESGYDYEDAQRAAAHARTSADHFFRENMKHFTTWLNDLKDAKNLRRADCVLTITINGEYYTQPADCRLQGIRLVRMWQVLDDLGGSACFDEMPGRVVESKRGGAYRIATPDEIDLIIDAYKKAAADHEKKVRAYLKKYGTSKVHAWTYWRDA